MKLITICIWLNRNKETLCDCDKKLYDNIWIKHLIQVFLEGCCNFKLLVEKCDEYSKETVA